MRLQAREKPVSMLASKSFEPSSDVEHLRHWLGVLSEELAERMVSDFEAHQRCPRLLVLHYR